MRIMPCGDSNTAAINPLTPADAAHWYGYRYTLKATLEAGGVPVDFVGSCSTGWVNMADCECEYWPGLGIAQIAARVTAGMLATYAPDCMILLIGTNDIRDPETGNLVSDEQAAIVVLAFRALVAQILAARPSMWLVIINPGTPIGGSMPIFRAGVLQCYTDQQAAGARVAYVDALGCASDGLHYSAAGQEELAGRLFPVVAGLIGMNLPPVPVVPVPADVPVRIPPRPVMEWTAQCFIMCGTHPNGPGSSGLVGRSVALAPDGSRLFIGGLGGPSEFVADETPTGYVGWRAIPDNVPWLATGIQHAQMALLPSNGALYGGTFTFDVENPPGYFNGDYPGGVLRASFNGARYTGEPAEYAFGSPIGSEAHGFFGYGKAISADGLVLAVGQPGYTNRWLGGLMLACGYGCVWIYDWVDGDWVVRSSAPTKDGTYWGPLTIDEKAPVEEDITEFDFFGSALALTSDGSTVFVGEMGHPWGNYLGNLYVFDWDGDSWGIRQCLHGIDTEDPGPYGAYRFGGSCCVTPDGNRLFVGAPRADNERFVQGGTVYVYELDAETNLYAQVDRLVTPVLTGMRTAMGMEFPNGFGSAVSCDATGELLAIGEAEMRPKTIGMDQPLPDIVKEYPGIFEGIVFIWGHALVPEISDAEKEDREPDPYPYSTEDEGTAILFPYRPLIPVTEVDEWTTDAVEAYTGTELRRGARQIPRQSWEWRVLVEDRAYYALFRGWQTQQFYVPTWHESAIYAGAIAQGAVTLTISAAITAYGEWRDQLAIWYSPGYCELVGIESIDGDTITLESAVTQNYPAGSTVMPARLCRMGTMVRAEHAKPWVLIDLSWVLLDAEDIEPFQLDSAELLATLPVAADGLLERELTSQVEELNYGTGALAFDVRRKETQWAFQCLQYHLSRQEAWEFKVWLYGLQGRRGGFWVPTGKSDLLIAAAALATDTTLTIERVNNYAWLFSEVTTDRYLYFQRPGELQPIVRQVTDAQPAVGDLEQITLDEALGIACEPGTFPYICWLHPVRLAADRIELSWEAPDRLIVTLPVLEVDAASEIE